ncbi:MAG: hypothetical protein LC130_23290 [Bryobacterales bacterium]|nr:hypothetical protein [Bryobacterales bacterium]
MTVLKTTYAPTVSGIVDGQQIDASDVTTPLTELRDYARAGRVAASASDLYLGTLGEKLAVVSPLVKTLLNSGADESQQLSFDTTGFGLDVTTLAGENITAGNFVALDYADSFKAWRIISTSANHYSRLRGYAVNTATTGNSITVRLWGIADGSFSAAGQDYWMPSSAGAPAATNPNPSAGGSQVCKLWAGQAISTTKVFYDIRPMRFAMRASLANNASMTIVLAPSESPVYIRRYWAIVNISTTIFEAAVVGRDGGGTRDVAVRLDNGSGSGDSNRITFKNVSGGTLDITGFCEID